MLKLNYTFTAQTPIQSFGDNNVGLLRRLRRERRLLKEKRVIPSRFSSHQERQEAIVEIIRQVWEELDVRNMDRNRIIGIYDELQSKLINATSCETKAQFLNRICQAFGIESLSSEKLLLIIERFNDDELLSIIREESQYLVLKFRVLKEKIKEKKEQTKLFTLSEDDDLKMDVSFVKSFEEIPYIAGNSIRGHLRRLLMRDFCKQVGISSLDKNVYHQLFTGGNLGDSSGSDDIKKREDFISMCPPLGLLGSAIGTQTIQGELKVQGARLQCLENGTGDLGFWSFIENKFNTRLDSSKQEVDIKVVEDDVRTKSATQQIFWSESFVLGSKFESCFVVTSDDDLLLSCFWRMIELFKENNFVGGNSARDAGMIELDIEVDSNLSKLYLDYLQLNKEQILTYFEVK